MNLTSDPNQAFEEAPLSRRTKVAGASGLVASLLVAVLTAIPAPYAIGAAGPTFDALERINVTGAPTFESSGELRLTTVSESSASSVWFTVGQVITAFFSPHRIVAPEQDDFDPGGDEQQVASAQQWVTSQEMATVAALEALGERVPVTLYVVEIEAESAALGLLIEDDIIRAIDGNPVVAFADLGDELATRAPGDVLTMRVLRNEVETDVEVPLIDNGAGGARLGIWVDPVFDAPVDVEVGISEVGGPSAGLMFALAIMDLLTPEDELRGASVAGTGTINLDGDVGAIGGIQLKMIGARTAGSAHFLAPIENCGEVLGHVPAGLNVYAVDNLADAYAAIVAIGQGDTADLPTCTSTKDAQ